MRQLSKKYDRLEDAVRKLIDEVNQLNLLFTTVFLGTFDLGNVEILNGRFLVQFERAVLSSGPLTMMGTARLILSDDFKERSRIVLRGVG